MANNNNFTAGQILFPIFLVALVLTISMGFQTYQIVRDRDALRVFISQQDKPVEDSRKLQAQLTALALGTKKLADGGDKSAIAIIARMQQAGITVGSPAVSGGPTEGVAPSPLPGASAPALPAMTPPPAADTKKP